MCIFRRLLNIFLLVVRIFFFCLVRKVRVFLLCLLLSSVLVFLLFRQWKQVQVGLICVRVLLYISMCFFIQFGLLMLVQYDVRFWVMQIDCGQVWVLLWLVSLNREMVLVRVVLFFSWLLIWLCIFQWWMKIFSYGLFNVWFSVLIFGNSVLVCFISRLQMYVVSLLISCVFCFWLVLCRLVWSFFIQFQIFICFSFYQVCCEFFYCFSRCFIELVSLVRVWFSEVVGWLCFCLVMIILNECSSNVVWVVLLCFLLMVVSSVCIVGLLRLMQSWFGW